MTAAFPGAGQERGGTHIFAFSGESSSHCVGRVLTRPHKTRPLNQCDTVHCLQGTAFIRQTKMITHNALKQRLAYEEYRRKQLCVLRRSFKAVRIDNGRMVLGRIRVKYRNSDLRNTSTFCGHTEVWRKLPAMEPPVSDVFRSKVWPSVIQMPRALLHAR